MPNKIKKEFKVIEEAFEKDDYSKSFDYEATFFDEPFKDLRVEQERHLVDTLDSFKNNE